MRGSLTMNELHEDLLSYYRVGRSFQGWLLTLNNEEFEEAKRQLVDDVETNDRLLFAFLYGGRGKVGDVDYDDLKADIIMVTLLCMRISHYKKGLIVSIKRGDDDNEWEWELTNEGKKQKKNEV